MIEPIAWLVLLPLCWAALSFVLGPKRGAGLALAGLAIQLMLALAAAQQAAFGHVSRHAAGGWKAPLGIELVLDGLAAVMLLLAQFVSLPLALYARAYFSEHPEGGYYFWPLAGFLIAAMNALFLSGDLFNIYVTLELLGLTAVGLVASAAGTGPLIAALRYLFATLLGSAAYLLGVALLYGTYGSVSLSILTPLVVQNMPNAVIAAASVMLAGLMLKTAIFPFHFWLPPAHGGAPAPVSALLSALVIKASFYLIMRLWLTLFMPATTAAAAQLLGALGAAAILWGSVMALRQERLKMLVAYSTVAQIGYLFLFFPLVTQTPPDAAQSAMQGAVMQAVSHGLAKAAMFAAAGAVVLSTGHDTIARFGGISGRLPLTLFTFGIAGVTLMGLPPSSGFIAKWLLIDAALASRQWGIILVMIVGGLLTAAYVFRVLRHAFLRVEQSYEFRGIPRMLEWPAFALALSSLGLGFYAGDILRLARLP